MGVDTGIEWADSTFNPWLGCQEVGPGCDHCYARAWAKRSGIVGWGPGAARRLASPASWRAPLKWQREAAEFAAKHGRRRRVFAASLADIFDNAAGARWRDDFWALVRDCPDLVWIVVTKRPGNIAAMLPPDWSAFGWPHVWLLASVCTTSEAQRDVPKLLSVPAVVHGLSMEPLLGHARISEFLPAARAAHGLPSISWVICGGESGGLARPMAPDWARSLRDQCAAGGAVFFFKQWGEWAPAPESMNFAEAEAWAEGKPTISFSSGHTMARLGKAAAGGALDGRRHHAWPQEH